MVAEPSSIAAGPANLTAPVRRQTTAYGARPLESFNAGLEVEAPVLRALLNISQALLRVQYFDEALEVIAEQALQALQATSLSISRWERSDNVLRTLINVGVLGPGEQRWPDDEVYPVAGDHHETTLLEQGLPYINSVDDPGADPAAVTTLRHAGRESELAVAVMFEGNMWGELWATGADGRRFGADDVQLLQAIAAQAAAAIGRTELFSTVWRYAFEDPLTGLANRRGLDKHFEEMNCAAVSPVVLIGDLDGLKETNDRDGHATGDKYLRGVAQTLSDVASATTGTLVARLGGDEFCVVMPHSTLDDAERFARDVSRIVRNEVGRDVSLSWGAAALASPADSGYTLMAAADAALLEAKRLGHGNFSVGVAGPGGLPGYDDPRRTTSEAARRAAEMLAPHVMGLLDRYRPDTTSEALEILAVQVCKAINGAAWSVSVTTDDGAGIRTHRGIHSARDDTSGLRVLAAAQSTDYPLADYPATSRAIANGETFIAAVDLAGCDPAEVALLDELGYGSVLAVGVRDAHRGYLLEIYSSHGHADLSAIASHVRVLAHYCSILGNRNTLASDH